MIWPARNSLKTWINWTQRRIASINQRPTSKGTNQRVLRGVCGWHGVEDGPKSCHLYCRTRPQPWSRATAQAAADPQNRRPRLVETARPTLGIAAPVCTRIAGRTVVHDAYTVCEAPFWALSTREASTRLAPRLIGLQLQNGRSLPPLVARGHNRDRDGGRGRGGWQRRR